MTTSTSEDPRPIIRNEALNFDVSRFATVT
jgi:hypothetical protein